MPDDEESLHIQPSLSATSYTPNPTSYVYPVRSVLVAHGVQPAAPISRSHSIDQLSNLSPTSCSMDINLGEIAKSHSGLHLDLSTESEGASRLREMVDSAVSEATQSEASGERRTVFTISQFQPSHEQDTPSSSFVLQSKEGSMTNSVAPMESESDRPPNPARTKGGPNFRHYPAGDSDPIVPRTFSTAVPVDLSATASGSDLLGQDDVYESVHTSSAQFPLFASPGIAVSSIFPLQSFRGEPSLFPTATASASPDEVTSSVAPQKQQGLRIQTGIENASFVQLAQGKPDEMTDRSIPSDEQRQDPQPKLPVRSSPSAEPERPPFTTPSSTEIAHEGTDLLFNPSQYGLVHLPPLPLVGDRSASADIFLRETKLSGESSRSRGSRSLSSKSSRSEFGRSEGSSHRYFSGFQDRTTTNTSVTSAENFSKMSGSACHGSGSGGSAPGSQRAKSSLAPSVKDTSSNNPSDACTGSSLGFSNIENDEQFVTFKFQYATDEHGNHVVVGREGKFQRCEDEPIRTPGAVQGFGVLIAVEDCGDRLVVRQVSENSTEILGLSPNYLFSLECFTDTLPESSAECLWDNTQFLIDPSHPTSEGEDPAPHIFMLHGWGEPGSALNQPQSGDSDAGRSFSLEAKRQWTCWCAVHQAQSLNESKPGLIVMEFELEPDRFNPLYTPIAPFSGSPSSSSTGATTSSSDITSPWSITTADSLYPSSVDKSSSASNGTQMMLQNAPVGQHLTNTLRHDSGLEGDEDWKPKMEDILESTTNIAKPLPALERLRRLTQRKRSPYDNMSPPFSPTLARSSPLVGSDSPRPANPRRRRQPSTGTVGMMDLLAVMTQINEQLGAAQELDTFLKVAVGLIKDLTQFHRVLIYQFDESWNGQVVAELVDWGVTKDLYRGLHFPASDIPKQARDLYRINKVRVLYDRSQSTARLVVRDREDLKEPLSMTHCYLRAMSPIHTKYLENMGVRASMSISIMAFGQLWGLIACHSYGNAGMRVSFPVRQMLRLLSQSISKNVERLSYAQRLHTRKLVNTLASDRRPTGYIVSNADDLLGLFDADFGILVIGEGAKILGPNQHGQEILIMAEYLRLKQFETIQASQAVINDFPDLKLTTGFEVIAGLLYVPLSTGGKDFIAFLRRGQLRDVHWAGRPFKDANHDAQANLEPRKSFKIWSETVAGRSRAWTDEQLETAGVLALLYGKFIEIWRQRKNALQTTKLTNILLSNATHEVRTPLNHIINYLEMAMNGPLDNETRDNLVRSHAASKSLLFTINDLLDLTRLESGNETSFNEPFNFHNAIEDAVHIYRREASRRGISFVLDFANSPSIVVGDSRKIRTILQNLLANSLKYTESGAISVSCRTFDEPEGLRSSKQVVVEIVVADTGCGIQEDKLEKIFREFEQVESSEARSNAEAGLGLGLAVVARIVEQLGGQLRVDSKINEGSRFSLLIPLALPLEESSVSSFSISADHTSISSEIHLQSSAVISSEDKVFESLVAALTSSHCVSQQNSPETQSSVPSLEPSPSFPIVLGQAMEGPSEAKDLRMPIRPLKVDDLGPERTTTQCASLASTGPVPHGGSAEVADPPSKFGRRNRENAKQDKLRILIIEDNEINRTILTKRLKMTGHAVVNAANGQEGVDIVRSDNGFDMILMDIQMPIVDGFEATQKIRALEQESPALLTRRLSHRLNGRIPIFAVSASLMAKQRPELIDYGMDGWILKPIDFTRLKVILKGITDPEQRSRDVYQLGANWEAGGWLENSVAFQPE